MILVIQCLFTTVTRGFPVCPQLISAGSALFFYFSFLFFDRRNFAKYVKCPVTVWPVSWAETDVNSLSGWNLVSPPPRNSTNRSMEGGEGGGLGY